MSNKTASVRITCSYTGTENESASLPAKIVGCLYQAQTHGTVDVPDLATTDTEYDIPFGAVAEATLVLVENTTGQDLWLKWNSANIESHKQFLKSGGCALIAMPDLPGQYPTTAVSVTTTATQSGAGTVAYHIFGDPT